VQGIVTTYYTTKKICGQLDVVVFGQLLAIEVTDKSQTVNS